MMSYHITSYHINHLCKAHGHVRANICDLKAGLRENWPFSCSMSHQHILVVEALRKFQVYKKIPTYSCCFRAKGSKKDQRATCLDLNVQEFFFVVGNSVGSTLQLCVQSWCQELHVCVGGSSPIRTHSNSCTEVTCLWLGGTCLY